MIQSDLDHAAGAASFMDLFRNKTACNGLIISVLLMVFQQFSGINAIIFYAVTIFKNSGTGLNASICAIIVGVTQVILTLISSLLIERAGRKALLIFSSTMMSISLAILGTYFDMKAHGKHVGDLAWLPLFCVILYMICYAIGYGPIPWLMMGELFLPNFKALAMGLSVMTNWFFVFVVTTCFGYMMAGWGSDFTFWFFASCMMVATIFVSLMVLETKGKTAAQIQSWLGGNR